MRERLDEEHTVSVNVVLTNPQVSVRRYAVISPSMGAQMQKDIPYATAKSVPSTVYRFNRKMYFA